MLIKVWANLGEKLLTQPRLGLRPRPLHLTIPSPTLACITASHKPHKTLNLPLHTISLLPPPPPYMSFSK